jgi:hypothetical protein
LAATVAAQPVLATMDLFGTVYWGTTAFAAPGGTSRPLHAHHWRLRGLSLSPHAGRRLRLTICLCAGRSSATLQQISDGSIAIFGCARLGFPFFRWLLCHHRLYGSMLCSSMALSFSGSMALGSMALWHHGTMALCLPGSVLYGTMEIPCSPLAMTQIRPCR